MMELGKNRIEALSDGIFAIAMTLLVLELHVPELPETASNALVAPALLHLWPKIATYIFSFITLGVYWVGHHLLYHGIRRADRTLLCLNLLFFLLVSFLPFSTSVLNAFKETQVGLQFFGVNLTCIGWILFAQVAYASSQPEMLADHISLEYRERMRNRFLTFALVATFTMLVCFWSVEISMVLYLAALPLYLIPERARVWGRSEQETTLPEEQDGSRAAL